MDICLGGSVAYAAATKLSGLSAAVGYYAGAVVRFWEKTLTTLEPRASTATGPDGAFVFTGQAAHHFALQAEQRGLGASPRTLYRRYFRGQNLVLDAPLRLRAGP